tara:strand:+ start:171 stop:395 length:225 start_codon:yes stop_codon:yes gene_type:complete
MEFRLKKKDVLLLLLCIGALSYCFYKLGQGNPIITEKIVKVEVMDKGFCMSCYKKHKWDEMYVIASEFEGFIYN